MIENILLDKNLTLVNITVIVPCFNCAKTIERAVKSIYDQSNIPSEIIMINDASDDGYKTIKAIDSIKNVYEKAFPQVSILVINLTKNMGPGYARNIGWENARFDYLAFLDSDDIWGPYKIELQHTFMMRHKQYTLTCHSSDRFESLSNNKNRPDNLSNFKEIHLCRLLFSNTIETRTVMIKKNIKLRFNSKEKFSEDYFLWLNLLASDYKALYFNTVLSFYFKEEYSSTGLSGNLLMMEIAEVKNLYRMYQSERISLVMLSASIVWSFLKFIRRCITKK